MSRPSGYQENLTSLKQETFSLVQNSNFLWFYNAKLSILKYKIFLVIGLWVIIKVPIHFPAIPPTLICNPIQLCKNPAPGWTPLTNYTPWPRFLMALQASAQSYPTPDVPQTHLKSELEFADSSCQAWIKGSKKQVKGKWGLNSLIWMFTVRSCLLWVRHILITRLPMAQDTNR